MKIIYNYSYTFPVNYRILCRKAVLAKLAIIVKILCSKEEILLSIVFSTGKNTGLQPRAVPLSMAGDAAL